MYSYKHFKPGYRVQKCRPLENLAILNALKSEINPNSEPISCTFLAYIDKDKFITNSTLSNLSRKQRYAQAINSNLGGNTQFGNSALGKPISVNYLGRTEGQLGGSGSPPINRF